MNQDAPMSPTRSPGKTKKESLCSQVLLKNATKKEDLVLFASEDFQTQHSVFNSFSEGGSEGDKSPLRMSPLRSPNRDGQRSMIPNNNNIIQYIDANRSNKSPVSPLRKSMSPSKCPGSPTRKSRFEAFSPTRFNKITEKDNEDDYDEDPKGVKLPSINKNQLNNIKNLKEFDEMKEIKMQKLYEEK